MPGVPGRAERLLAQCATNRIEIACGGCHLRRGFAETRFLVGIQGGGSAEECGGTLKLTCPHQRAAETYEALGDSRSIRCGAEFDQSIPVVNACLREGVAIPQGVREIEGR